MFFRKLLLRTIFDFCIISKLCYWLSTCWKMYSIALSFQKQFYELTLLFHYILFHLIFPCISFGGINIANISRNIVIVTNVAIGSLNVINKHSKNTNDVFIWWNKIWFRKCLTTKDLLLENIMCFVHYFISIPTLLLLNTKLLYKLFTSL